MYNIFIIRSYLTFYCSIKIYIDWQSAGSSCMQPVVNVACYDLHNNLCRYRVVRIGYCELLSTPFPSVSCTASLKVILAQVWSTHEKMRKCTEQTESSEYEPIKTHIIAALYSNIINHRRPWYGGATLMLQDSIFQQTFLHFAHHMQHAELKCIWSSPNSQIKFKPAVPPPPRANRQGQQDQSGHDSLDI